MHLVDPGQGKVKPAAVGRLEREDIQPDREHVTVQRIGQGGDNHLDTFPGLEGAPERLLEGHGESQRAVTPGRPTGAILANPRHRAVAEEDLLSDAGLQQYEVVSHCADRAPVHPPGARGHSHRFASLGQIHEHAGEGRLFLGLATEPALASPLVDGLADLRVACPRGELIDEAIGSLSRIVRSGILQEACGIAVRVGRSHPGDVSAEAIP